MPRSANVCEVCARPVEDTDLVKVGACEFPFFVHEGCRDQMAPVAGFVEDLCRLAEDQPSGLLWLGSWDGTNGEVGRDETPSGPVTEEPGDADDLASAKGEPEG